MSKFYIRDICSNLYFKAFMEGVTRDRSEAYAYTEGEQSCALPQDFESGYLIKELIELTEVSTEIPLSLGYNSQTRKETPMLAVVFGYFAAAMAGLTRHAVRSNEKHNPGEPVHWARGKSMDHSECSLRHLVDSAEIRAWLKRNPTHSQREAALTMLEHELDAKVWRAAAEAQEFYEEFRGAPLSFSARLPGTK